MFWNNHVFFFKFQYDVDYIEFRSQIDALRANIQNFMDSWFSRSLTVSILSTNTKNKKNSFHGWYVF